MNKINELILCKKCNCMTKTIKGHCGKCKEPKPLSEDPAWVKKTIAKAKKFWAKYEKQSWWKYFQDISPLVNCFLTTTDLKNGVSDDIIATGEDVRDMKFAVAERVEKIVKESNQQTDMKWRVKVLQLKGILEKYKNEPMTGNVVLLELNVIFDDLLEEE